MAFVPIRAKGFKLRKVNLEEADVYHVHLDSLACACECKGFLRWNKCKHFDTQRTLTERGTV